MSRFLASAGVAIAAVVLTVALGLPASAHHEGAIVPVEDRVQETVTLSVNNYTAYTFTMSPGDAVRYDIRTLGGTEIDVYLVPPDGLSDYVSETAPEFRFFARVENQRNISGSYALGEGILAVIVDNVDLTPDGAMPLGPVEVSVGLTRETNTLGSGWVLAAVGLVIFGSVLIGAVAGTVVLKRRRTSAGPAPSRPTPPTPYEAPPEIPPPKEP